MDGGIRRPVARLLGLGSIALGLGAALVGLLQTQRTCTGIFDQACDGPHWGDAIIAFAIAAALVVLGLALLASTRHRRIDRDVDAG